MSIVSVMRHGHAAPQQPGQTDFDRPLDARGVVEVSDVARHWRNRTALPDMILASPATRTRQSADILLRDWDASMLPTLRQPLYNAALDTLVAELCAQLKALKTAGHILLVGHNPGMSELARWLDAEATHFALATAHVFTFELPVEAVLSLSAHSGRRLSFDSPSPA